ncbi:MAG: hypothetical protein AAFO82_09640, partial [Bacteroidota bacterium]
LEAKSEDFVLLNAADIFIGGCYLIFLTSIAHRFFGTFLPNFKSSSEISNNHSTIASKAEGFGSYLLAFGIGSRVPFTIFFKGIFCSFFKSCIEWNDGNHARRSNWSGMRCAIIGCPNKSVDVINGILGIDDLRV